MYIYIGNFATLYAQNPADVFADSMFLTTSGQLMYNSCMQGPFDSDVDSASVAEYLTLSYYKGMYYDSLQPRYLGLFNNDYDHMCYNRHFTLSEPSA